MLRTAATLFFLFTGIIFNTIPRYLNFELPYDSEEYKTNYWLYCRGQGFSFLLILLAGVIKDNEDKLSRIFFDFTIGLAINNLIDELYFDPLHLGWNEIVFGGIVFIITIGRVKLFVKE